MELKGEVMDVIHKFFAATFLFAVLLFSSVVNAALVGRLALTEGGTDYQAYYDDDLDITWAANANINGIMMNWADANTWAAGLDIGGVTGWRLPTTTQPDPSCDEQYDAGAFGLEGYFFNCTGSEMGHLYYNELGGTALTSILTTGDPTELAKFSNFQASYYWSATERASDTNYAWGFFTLGGSQGGALKSELGYAWAVQSGDIAAVVPVPAAFWLFSSGLLGLIGIAKRKKA